MRVQKAYFIRDPGDVGEARRAAVALAAGAGFSETDQGKVALVTTEAGTNIVKHGKSGQIILGSFPTGSRGHGVEVLALDRGPGMQDVARCLQDGYSTAGSPGTGLGAIVRLSNEFDIHSTPGAGTVLVARVLPSERATASRPCEGLQVGVICLPVYGEHVPGDAWDHAASSERAISMVVDGLGHGPLAAQAAQEALRVFSGNSGRSPDDIVQMLHTVLRSTRGAAVAIAEIRATERKLRFCGVGNIAARACTALGSKSFVSQNGTAGLEIRRTRLFEYDWPEHAHLIMHSDGLATRWDLQKYPGILARDPSVIAGVLYRDYARGHDDVTVLVAREREVER